MEKAMTRSTSAAPRVGHLNLTLARGPSVWDTKAAPVRPWRLAALAAGVALTGGGWPFRSPSRRALAGLGLLTLAVALGGDRLLAAARAHVALRSSEREQEDAIDRTIEASFPASDPAAH